MSLRAYKADLHIHTVLSPCTDIAEMTPRAIVERALSKGLDLIAICDHNSSENVGAVQQAARGLPLAVLAGMEVTSREEVHTLGIFDTVKAIEPLQHLVYGGLPGRNDPELFGYQIIMDEHEEAIGMNERLLAGTTDRSLEEIVACIHRAGGLAISSHCEREGFGILPKLGFVPEGLPLDALELSRHTSMEHALREMPQLKGFAVIRSSDAHYLDDIGDVWTTFWIEEGSVSEIRKALRKEAGRGYSV